MTDNKVDDLDVFYLANVLTPEQVQKEIKGTKSMLNGVREIERWPCVLLWGWLSGGGDECGRQIAYTFSADDIHGVLECYFGFDWEWWLNTLQEAQKCHRRCPVLRTPFTTRLNIDEVKSRNDILAVAEGYTKLKKSGRNYIGSCPLHEDRHPSFVVYPDEQRWHCYQCNRGGDVISLVMAAERIDFHGAAAALGAR